LLSAQVFAVTFDTKNRIFYTGLNQYLGDSQLFGMDVDSGEIVSSPTFSYTLLIQSLAYDEGEDSGFGVVEVGDGKGNWQKRFAAIDLATLKATVLGGDDWDLLDAYTQHRAASRLDACSCLDARRGCTAGSTRACRRPACTSSTPTARTSRSGCSGLT